MLHSTLRALFIFICLALTLPAGTALAAGSGGGGMSGVPADTRRAASPEEASQKRLRSGIRHRDKAHKHEERAAAATSEKKRAQHLKKAAKAYERAIAKQGEAIKLDPQNYKAANELGYAYRKTGEFRKAIGAYNYALEINPNYHQATEYRAEAFLALGLIKQTQQSYMILFRNDRKLASMLMEKVEAWLAEREGSFSETETELANWVAERKRLASLNRDLSFNNTRSW